MNNLNRLLENQYDNRIAWLEVKEFYKSKIEENTQGKVIWETLYDNAVNELKEIDDVIKYLERQIKEE